MYQKSKINVAESRTKMKKVNFTAIARITGINHTIFNFFDLSWKATEKSFTEFLSFSCDDKLKNSSKLGKKLQVIISSFLIFIKKTEKSE